MCNLLPVVSASCASGESGAGAFFRAFDNMDELDLVEYRVAGMPLHWKILNAARSGKCDWNHGQLTFVDGWRCVKRKIATLVGMWSLYDIVCIDRN